MFDVRLRLYACIEMLYAFTTDEFLQTDVDAFTMRQRLLVRILIGGHADPELVQGIADKGGPLLKDETLRDEDSVMRLVRAHLQLLADAPKPRHYPRYVRANARHLETCEECRKTLCHSVRNEVEVVVLTRKSTNGIKPDERQRLIQLDVPAEVRQRILSEYQGN